MDLETKLTTETDAQLEQRRRNAKYICDNSPGTPKAKEAERIWGLIDAILDGRCLPGSIKSFREAYPGGFDDELFIKQERKDKVEASKECIRALSLKSFQELETGSDPMVLIGQVKRIVNMTNLIQGSFEKPKLIDAISKPENTREFLKSLEDLLHGPGDAPDRLERFSDHMHTLGLRKWTYGTYFLFLMHPENYIFVKPEGIKKALDMAKHPIRYDPVPTASLYREILAFANKIESKLRAQGEESLNPKDMIDTQSFIWHMAPTGKHSR
jgi:hypothetical protein